MTHTHCVCLGEPTDDPDLSGWYFYAETGNRLDVHALAEHANIDYSVICPVSVDDANRELYEYVGGLYCRATIERLN